MRALDESGTAVSWWFAYKLPHTLYTYDGDPGSIDLHKHSTAKVDGAGYRYLFHAAGDPGLPLSPHDLQPGGTPGAISRTLAQVFDSPASTVGYVAYNDEFPHPTDLADVGAADTLLLNAEGQIPGDSSAFGHNKGVLAWDCATGEAFWMLHSFPRWPAPGQTAFPSSSSTEKSRLSYAQSFLCVSLKDLKALDDIAWMMRRFHEPQVIHSHIPDAGTPIAATGETLGGLLPELVRLVAENGPTGSPPESRPKKDTAEEAGELTFQAWKPDGGPDATTTFRLMAKGPLWDEDFWIDLIAHRLGVNLLVETWRRDLSNQKPGALHTPHSQDADGDTVDDASAVLLAEAGLWFKEGSDHAKWAVGAAPTDTLVCVGDINRQSSQAVRGGGTLAFHDATLAGILRSALWMTARERAGLAEIKTDSAGNLIAASDETANQAQDLVDDARRDDTGAATDT